MRKRYIFLIIVVLPLVIWQSLNQNNFCYADMRFNKPYEVLDRFLFGEDHRSMSLEEKIEYAANDPKGALKYPNCCLAYANKEQSLGWLARAFGMGSYKLFILNPPEGNGDGAYNSILYVDQCANYSGDRFGERLSEESYIRNLKSSGLEAKRERVKEQ
jgi:hypothetical protein